MTQPQSGTTVPVTGMTLAAEMYAKRQACQIPAKATKDDVYQLLFELAKDIASPLYVGMPAEVVKRASRILSMAETRRNGYGQPPPVRCEACEES